MPYGDKVAGVRRKKIAGQMTASPMKEKKSQVKIGESKKRQNTIEWTTFYRRNWHIYAMDVLHIPLKPFQQIVLWLMGNSDIFFMICSRGLSKTFITGLGAVIKMNLYPYSEVVATSSTADQANIIVEKKIKNEIFLKLSDYLMYLYKNQYITITKPDDGYLIYNWLNHSSIVVKACLESSRGVRSTFLIYDEVRLLKKKIVDGVFEQMAHPRQAIYWLNNPKYQTKRWTEDCQHVYLTSAYYKFYWFWNVFKTTFTRYFTDNYVRCNIFAGDIFMSIKNGLKTWADYRNYRNGGEEEFRMESLNEMIGESENAFFTYRSFKENQVLERVFRLPTPTQFYVNEDLGNPAKKEREIRLVITDFAMTNSTNGSESDHTIFLLMSLHWKGTRFERHVDYLGTHPGGDSLGATDRIREIFQDYQADYYIPDLRNGGEALYNYISMPRDNPERGLRWDRRGFTICTDKELQIVSDGKLQDLASRTVDKEAIPCMIPIVGSKEFNTNMWIELRKQLEANNIKFPVSMQRRQELLEDSGAYYQMDSDELVADLASFGQIDELIHECVELQATFKEDAIKLTETRSGFKDRAICLAYGNAIASRLENIWNRSMTETETNIDEIELVW